MSKITKEQIIEIYQVSKDVYLNKLEVDTAIIKLENDLGINPTYASIFIANLRCLLKGKVFKRTMGALAFDYYLSQIIIDFGEGNFNLCLQSLKLHINYLENHYKSKKNKLRSLLSKYEDNQIVEVDLIDLHNDFHKQVKKSLSLSTKERKKRINSACKKPHITSIVTKVYSRNPDIVAERLFLANGFCEKCEKPAPFKKAKDGNPYLEVHHKKQLAHGGEDTLENTEALCPNCHRWKHFGFT